MRTWLFLQNTFLTITANSFRQCQKIIDYTLAALQGKLADPYFAALHSRLQPAVAAFTTAYTMYHVAITQQKAQTSILDQAFKTLQSSKIAEWDIHIQVQYPQHSQDYQLLLPYRRKPFQIGSQEDRMSAVGVLALGLSGFPSLAAIHTDVVAYRDSLATNYNLQKQRMGIAEGNNIALEAARKTVCNELYYTLAMLMAYYYDQPHRVDAYFDTESIRQHRQSTYQHRIKAGETRLALTHTFEAHDELRIINRGTTDLLLSLCANAKSIVAEPAVSIAPNSEIRVLAEDLGDVETHRFLKVKNLSEVDGGAYTLKLL